MASPQPPSDPQQRTIRTKDELPDGVTEILAKSLQLGAGAGTCGLLFGATAGVVRGTTPVLFSIVSGLQWFGLGSVYYGTRSMAIARYGPGHDVTPSQKVGASALGGAVSGMTVGGIMRGTRNILPAALVFSLLGGGGQFAVNKWTGSSDAPTEKKSDNWFAKFSPMKRLSDQEYEAILEEKLLRLEAEIAIIDEDIAALKAQEKQKGSESTRQTPSTMAREKS
ncbi:hypothetical protein M406DRAFT_248692 [Cryphonectria parasitica EP155]|uniref:Uncharacterized protein n=1 Tax=Cryphonectria parasitica (strain ATCC 38755 / EP155) TaxID=660469 RepID=A0A9P4YBE8_CRYP1|nr:uncharacterized protein M406DRAFT_248692 [Cryphonectria parasitica EP155]KAF3769575.1 hypothetical protein M406DRAFT_248692 [Cryphonectria parasitica EP155]